MKINKQSVFPTVFCALCSPAQAQNQGILDGFGWEGTLKPIPALPGAGTPFPIPPTPHLPPQHCQSEIKDSWSKNACQALKFLFHLAKENVVHLPQSDTRLDDQEKRDLQRSCDREQSWALRHNSLRTDHCRLWQLPDYFRKLQFLANNSQPSSPATCKQLGLN